MAGMVPMLWDMRRVRRMLAGDRDAGERWVVSAYPRVYRMLRSLTGASDLAEDLTQQTFVQAWQSLGTFRGASSLDTWLHRIAYHVYTHWLRDKREAEPLGEGAHVVGGSDIDGLTTMIVQQALASLPDDMRETFVLFYVQQFSVREIGRLLDVPPGTVKSRLFATRRRMREILSGRTSRPVAQRIQGPASCMDAMPDACATVAGIRDA